MQFLLLFIAPFKINLLSSAQLFPMSKDGYLKEGILLFRASSLNKFVFFVLFFTICVFPIRSYNEVICLKPAGVIAWSRK